MERFSDLMKRTSLNRRVLLITALLVAAVMAITLMGLILGAAINAPRFIPVVQTAVETFTDLSFETRKIRFRYPLDLRLDGLVVEGDIGGIHLRVQAERVETRSGLRALCRGTVDSILIRDLKASLRIGRERARPEEGGGAPLEIPWWAWRIRVAEIRNAFIEVEAGNAPLGLERLDLSWLGDPGSSSGALTVSLRDGSTREDDITVRFEHDRFFPGREPVVLPDLVLSSLAAFAGVKLPVAGTLSGTLRPLPAAGGMEGVCIDLKAEGLGMQGSELPVHFEKGQLTLHIRVLFPLRIGKEIPAAEGFRLSGNVEGTVQGIRIRETAPPRNLEPLRFRVLAEMHAGTGKAGWEGEASDGLGLFTLQGRGTAAGILAGRPPGLEASVTAACTDLPLAVSLFAPAASRLPGGLQWGGGTEAVLEMKGTTGSMEIHGKLKSKNLFLHNGKGGLVPVRMTGELKGLAGDSGIRELEISTRRFRVGKLASLRGRIGYTPETVRFRMSSGSSDLAKIAEFLEPILPQPVQGFQWGGDLNVSMNGQATPGTAGPLQADFRVALKKGQFASGDYQQMGEGVGLEMNGTVSLLDRGETVGLNMDASVSGGEVVYEGLYINLTPHRPVFHLEAASDRSAARVILKQSVLELADIGTFRLRGTQTRTDTGMERRAELETRDINLETLARLSQEGGFGERWPVFHTLHGSGRMELRAALYQGKGPPAARGLLVMKEGSFSQESRELSVAGIQAHLPFSVGPAEAIERLPGQEGAEKAGGKVSTGQIDFRGIRIPGVQASLQVYRDRVALMKPLKLEVAGGRLEVSDLSLDGLSAGTRNGRVSLALARADLAPLTRALLGMPVEGKVSAEVPLAGLKGGRLFTESGRFHIQAGRGRITMENLTMEYSPSPGEMKGRFTLSAEAFPLEALSAGVMNTPVTGTLDGSLAPVEISRGVMTASGELHVAAWDGTIRISRIRGTGLPGPTPLLEADLQMRGLQLAEISSPLSFGRISGVLQGEIQGLRIGRSFPYLEAFRMDLETVKMRGVPQKIGARAVENISKIGGSSALTSAVSSGVMSFFDEYYYKKIGVRATLAGGWLELHGIPKKGNEYLILRSWRLPTLSMPLKVLSADRKIRFRSWVSYLESFSGSN